MAVQARTVHLYYTDPQGTVLAKTDAQGNILARYDYRPYGGVVSGDGPDGPGYTGHVRDPETGLVYMQPFGLNNMKLALLLFLTLVTCICRAGDLDRFCFAMGGEEVVCYVSINTLISRGKDFEGQTVITHGYFAYSNVSIIFSSRDDFLTSNTANGLLVSMPKSDALMERLYSLNHRMVMLRAKFIATPADLMGNQGYRVSGRLYDIKSVDDSFMPWGYLEHEPPPYQKKQGR
jgi:hypothetical protein